MKNDPGKSSDQTNIFYSMHSIQLVVFDIAGTTVSDRGDIAIAFIDACKKHGYHVAVEEVNKVMGFRKKMPSKFFWRNSILSRQETWMNR